MVFAMKKLIGELLKLLAKYVTWEMFKKLFLMGLQQLLLEALRWLMGRSENKGKRRR